MYTIPKNIEELSNGEILTVFFENMKEEACFFFIPLHAKHSLIINLIQK